MTWRAGLGRHFNTMAEEGYIDSSSRVIDPKNGKYYAKNGIVSTWALIYVKSTSTPGQRRSGASGTSSGN